jgi:hypothetical protein
MKSDLATVATILCVSMSVICLKFAVVSSVRICIIFCQHFPGSYFQKKVYNSENLLKIILGIVILTPSWSPIELRLFPDFYCNLVMNLVDK